ncbi:hypothetical protein IWQ61_000495 [Dispira simplex]|nr:hypothetical protein IWQ61_000495 [Dispira simplex]
MRYSPSTPWVWTIVGLGIWLGNGWFWTSPFAGAHAHSGHTGVELSHDIDTRLWLHILCMGLAYGVLFPVGAVLGITRNRFHVPVQAVGSCLVVVGYFLGHYHGGRQFGETAHVYFSRVVMLAFFVQIGCGVYLKLHLERYLKRDYLRPIIRIIHRSIGYITMLLAWVQVLLGFIALTGFCYADHFGQCLAHFIMGSSFVWYGVWLLFSLTLAGPWLRSKGRSPEFYDSVVILAWGIFNTFTEHRWDEPWTHKDLQHTAMGILWWCGGILGILMTWRAPPHSRSMVPALIILFTGLAMAAHHQHTEFSTRVHAYFGGALCIAGITRIIELFMVSFYPIGKDIDSGVWPHPFRYVPPFFLMLSGTMFMSANEESIQTLVDAGAEPASYCLLIVAVAFMLFFMAYGLMTLYRYLAPRYTTDLGYHPVGEGAHHAFDQIPIHRVVGDHGNEETAYSLQHRHVGGQAVGEGLMPEAHTQTIFDIASNDSFDDDPNSAVTLREEVELRAVKHSPLNDINDRMSEK